MAEIVIPLGKDAVLYYGTAGGGKAATGSLTGARDVTITMERDEADASRRAYPGWHDQRAGMKNLRISFELAGTSTDPVGTEDTELDIIRGAYLTGAYNGATGIALFAKAEDTGGEGMYGDFIITKFDRNEPLNDIQSYSVEAVMTLIHGNTPAWG